MKTQRARLVVGVSLFVILGGCDDGTSPTGDLAGLDPARLSAALTELVTPLNASDMVSTNLSRAFSDLETAGVEFDRALSPLRIPVRGLSVVEMPLRPAAVTFPEAVLGRTFVFMGEDNSWDVDEARDDAPSDGVRVEWYELDGADEIRMPLMVYGYADLTPAEHTGLEGMQVRAVETAGGGNLVLLDFVQAGEVTGSTMWTEIIRIAGTYSNESTTVEFDIASDAQGDDDADTETYTFDAVLEEPGIRYELTADGDRDADGGFEDRIEGRVDWEGSTTVLELTLTGGGDSQEVTGRLLHDGQHLADVSADGNLYTFTTPDGGDFSPQQSTALNDLFRRMLLVGLQPLFNLPLAFV